MLNSEQNDLGPNPGYLNEPTIDGAATTETFIVGGRTAWCWGYLRDEGVIIIRFFTLEQTGSGGLPTYRWERRGSDLRIHPTEIARVVAELVGQEV